MKKLISCLLCLTIVIGLVGCGTQKLDNPSLQEGQSASSAPVEGTEVVDNGGFDAHDDKSGFDVGDVESGFDIKDSTDETIDFSKYEEDKSIQNGTEAVDNGGFNIKDSTDETMDFSNYEEDKYHTTQVPDGMQEPVEPEDQNVDENTDLTCYLAIYCDTILYNMEMLTEGKESLVPSDGVILPLVEITFHPGESVYDILLRETRDRMIHMESSFTPMYNSAYIEGINNLYEFDCGSESGWMYCVNGWFPNYGVSRYEVQSGDVIEFKYTCDLGRDVGDQYWDMYQ